MAEEELGVVKLLDNYYRDSFGRVIFIISGIGASIILLLAISLYLFLNKPVPVVFSVADEWRVVPPVPIQEPYLSDSETLQWASNVIPQLFNLSFINIDEHMQDAKKYFTDNGYDVFINQFNNYIDKTALIKNRMFVHSAPTAAPFVINKGVLSGRYAWWVQFPVTINFSGPINMRPVDLTLQVLVVRTETINNLSGVLIDNIIAVKGLVNGAVGIGNP